MFMISCCLCSDVVSVCIVLLCLFVCVSDVILFGYMLIGQVVVCSVWLNVWMCIVCLLCLMLLFVLNLMQLQNVCRLGLVWKLSRLNVYSDLMSLWCGGMLMSICVVGNGMCRKKLMWFFILVLCSVCEWNQVIVVYLDYVVVLQQWYELLCELDVDVVIIVEFVVIVLDQVCVVMECGLQCCV